MALQSVDNWNRGWEWSVLWGEATNRIQVAEVPFQFSAVTAGIGHDARTFYAGTASNEVRRIAIKTGKPEFLLDLDGPPLCITPSDDGRVIASSSGGDVAIFREDELAPRRISISGAHPIACWPGRTPDEVLAWDEVSHTVYRINTADGTKTAAGTYASVILPTTPTGHTILLENKGETFAVTVADKALNRVVADTFERHDTPRSFDVDALTNRAVIGTSQGTLRVYDTASGSQLIETNVAGRQVNAALEVAIDGVEERIFVATMNELLVFDLITGRELVAIKTGYNSPPFAMRWDRETGTLAIVNRNGGKSWWAEPKQQRAVRSP